MSAFTHAFCTSAAVSLVLLVVMGIWHLGSNSMIACGFAGAFFFQVGSRPNPRHLLAAVAAGAGYGAAYALLGTSFGGSIVQVATGLGAFLGLGSLTVMTLVLVLSDSRTYVEPLRPSNAVSRERSFAASKSSHSPSGA